MNGQELIVTLRAWIGRYIRVTEPVHTLVLALYAVHTYWSERFPGTAYLVINSDTTGAGKTLCMEIVGSLCRHFHLLASMRMLGIVRLIESCGGRCTLAFDEVERLARRTMDDAASLLHSGYRRGATHLVTSGKGAAMYSTYCPKMFGLIGDVHAVLRARSIVITLRRAAPERDWYAERLLADGEAQGLRDMIMRAPFGGIPQFITPDFLDGREREIWAPLWSIAQGLRLHKPTIDELVRGMVDLAAGKTAPARRYTALQDAEDTASDTTYAERALRDLQTVLAADERAIFSAVAVERMRSLDTSPWRTWRGEGLNTESLAALVSRYGVHPRQVKIAGRNLRGYRARDIREVAR